MSDEKKRGRGRPKGSSIGPKKPDPRKDVPDASKPECRQKWQDSKGTWHVCRKRGYHWKHGK